MTHINDMDSIFRVLEEEIRRAGSEDRTVPDILSSSAPGLTATTKEGIRAYIQGYQSWIELAKDMVDEGFASDEEMRTKLAAIRGILYIAQYYIERLHAAVDRDRDVPWETRVAVDLMLTAFGQQLGA